VSQDHFRFSRASDPYSPALSCSSADHTADFRNGLWLPGSEDVRPLNSHKHSVKEDITKCRKYGGRHPTLSPGLFTLQCTHGVIFGFELMRHVETPQTPFELIYSRFEKAPRIFVYDNSCSLLAYAMKREPLFFAGTSFFVDRLHWKIILIAAMDSLWTHLIC